MATTIDWPTTLPQKYQHNGFSRGRQGNLLRTEMDSGRPKVRRLFTAVSTYFTGTMVMDGTQLSAFETFFDDVLGSGALTFNFPNPLDYGATTVEVRFRVDTKAEPYTATPDGETTDWSVTLNLETIP